MRIVQFEIPDQGRRVGVVDGRSIRDVTSVRPEWRRVTDVFRAGEETATAWLQLLDEASQVGEIALVEYETLLSGGPDSSGPFLHPPLDAEDPHYVCITGTGLTHLGSMKSRDSMHAEKKSTAPATDSSKMFQMGIEGGKPGVGERGTAPEWFYKGDGWNLRGHRWTLSRPSFARDGGEEAEIVGCYIVDLQGSPRRLGFAVGNEWSDHATERINYLYLAPSKLRQCAVGPELITDWDYQEMRLQCRVLRRGETLYESGELLTGEQHMCHSVANCEDHHFKYPQHRRPGDVHLHYFGTSKLSYGARDWVYEEGDEIHVIPESGAALVNTVLADVADESPIRVQPG